MEARMKVKQVPDGYHTVTPFVIVKGAAQFLDFMGDAFGAEEIGRVPGEAGSIGHAETRIGDSVVMTFDAKEDWPWTPSFLRLYVEDGDSSVPPSVEGWCHLGDGDDEHALG
jgi:PhnB protein